MYLPGLADQFGRAVAVIGPGNQAPDAVVTGVVVATRVLVVAPAFAAVVHGVFQSTLTEGAGPSVALVATALLVVVAKTPFDAAGAGGLAVTFAAVALFAVAAAAGYAHERTGNLLLPAATYGLFVAATTVAWSGYALGLHPAI